MKELDELERKYKALGDKIEKLKNSDRLKLEVDSRNYLILAYKDKYLGFITDEGRCTILSEDSSVELYEQWIEEGQLVDESIVEWRGGKYQVAHTTAMVGLIRKDITWGEIYNLFEGFACRFCGDENIKRFEHTSRPIIY